MDPNISDLFFNYDHAEFSALFGEGRQYSDEAAREAIKEDAETFATSVSRAFGMVLDPEELVEDFFSRL